MENLLIEITPGYTLECIDHFYRHSDGYELTKALLQLKERPEVVHIFGEDVITKCNTIQYAVTYAYNRRAKEAQYWTWTQIMSAIRERGDSIAGPPGQALLRACSIGKAGITLL